MSLAPTLQTFAFTYFLSFGVLAKGYYLCVWCPALQARWGEYSTNFGRPSVNVAYMMLVQYCFLILAPARIGRGRSSPRLLPLGLVIVFAISLYVYIYICIYIWFLSLKHLIYLFTYLHMYRLWCTRSFDDWVPHMMWWIYG